MGNMGFVFLFLNNNLRTEISRARKRSRRENAVAAKYLRTQIKAKFVHKESSMSERR